MYHYNIADSADIYECCIPGYIYESIGEFIAITHCQVYWFEKRKCNGIIKGYVYFFPCLFFPRAHVITVLLYVVAGDFSPSGARTLVLLKGVWFFPHMPGGAGSGPFYLPPLPPSGLQLQISGCWLPCWLTT